ncbi:Protein translocase subunit SecA [bioreactor metagenome]|uniref:Protein translocase subunit SecA n=1 Tax=bioreactor metagenome TaxID=1076179 RepID=A0A645ENM3_9ZZZZ
MEYDDVLRQQREIIYDQRNFILDNEDVHSIVHDMFDRVVAKIVKGHSSSDRKGQSDIEAILSSLKKMELADGVVTSEMLAGKTVDEIVSICQNKVWEAYEGKIAPIREQIKPLEKVMVLKILDRAWINHIDIMSKLRDGIHLRSYAQSNPLQAYVEEGYQMFEEVLAQISQEVVTFCIRLKIKVEEKM